MVEFELQKSIYIPILISIEREDNGKKMYLQCVRKYINTPDLIFIQ